MLRVLAILMGIVFVISGVMGFIPEFTQDGKLFGIFAINSVRNMLHIGIGALGLLSGLKSATAAKVYFIVFGLIFLTFAAVGFYHSTGEIFHYIIANSSDNWLNAAMAVLFLYFGLTFIRK